MSYFPLPSLTPFYLLSFPYFHLKFYFISCYNLFPFHTLTIALPSSLSKSFVIVISHLTFFFPLLKYHYYFHNFISICSLVVDMVVVLHFFSFISRSPLFLYFKSPILPLSSPTPLCLHPTLFYFCFKF